MAGSEFEQARQSPTGPPMLSDVAISEAPKPIIFKSYEQLTKLTEEELYSYICGPILDAENKVFSPKRNTGLHKQACLTGGPHKDVTRIRDTAGMPVYMHYSENVRAPEVMEALVEVANYRNGINKSPVELYSEVSDLSYNLVLLTVLDPKAELKYESREFTYRDCVKELADSLGLQAKDLLLLAAIKYTQRLGSGRKNLATENALINRAISEASVPTPAISNMDRSYRVIVAVDEMIENRFEYLALIEGWNLSAPLGNSNHIFK